MAMMAAMKKVLSPISDSRIIPHDLMNPCRGNSHALEVRNAGMASSVLQGCGTGKGSIA